MTCTSAHTIRLASRDEETLALALKLAFRHCSGFFDVERDAAVIKDNEGKSLAAQRYEVTLPFAPDTGFSAAEASAHEVDNVFAKYESRLRRPLVTNAHEGAPRDPDRVFHRNFIF
jgi:hypothetical protein